MLETQSIKLAAQGKDAALKAKLDNGSVKVTDTDAQGNTLLHWAALHGREDVITLLIEHGALITQKNNRGETALDFAAQKGHYEIVTNLLNKHPELVTVWQAHPEEKLLHYAVQGGDSALVLSLLQAFTTELKIYVCSQYDAKLNTPLHVAAIKGGENGVIHSLLGAWKDPQARLRALEECNGNGWTPLHLAAHYGHTEIVAALLENYIKKEDLKKFVARSGVTPMHLAVQGGHAEIVKKLLAHDAEITADSDGVTPMHLAASNGQIDSLALLLDSKGSSDYINAPDSAGLTPLHRAAAAGCLDAVKLLLQKGAVFERRTNNYETPLHLAAAKGHAHIIEFLLDYYKQCLDLDDDNAKSQTALHLASQKCHAAVVKVLTESGADAGLKDEKGNTPLALVNDLKIDKSDKLMLHAQAETKKYLSDASYRRIYTVLWTIALNLLTLGWSTWKATYKWATSDFFEKSQGLAAMPMIKTGAEIKREAAEVDAFFKPLSVYEKFTLWRYYVETETLGKSAEYTEKELDIASNGQTKEAVKLLGLKQINRLSTIK